jgi:hypothetical protein
MARTPLLLALAVTVLAAGSARADCLPPPDGLLAWYPGERHADDAAGFHHGHLFDGASFVDAFNGEGFRFDGVDDFLATDTTDAEQRAVRTSFTYSMWAKPTGALPGCAETSSGACFGLPWAIFPTHGDVSAPAGENGLAAGIGIAIGTNGVCVGQHAAFLVSCLALHSAPITGWTHVVAVVENKTPRIYVNGQLVRSGVASDKQFVFAAWNVLGSGLSLGRYSGDLDEVQIFGRALDDTEIGELFLAGAQGLCPAACAQRADDAFEGALVTANSGLRSNLPDGLFGATNLSPEPDSLLFEDGKPDGTVHSIEWRIDAPVLLTGFGLRALHDSVANTQRALRHVKLQARPVGGVFQTVYERDVLVPYRPAGNELMHCARLRPALYQEFRAEFTQDGPAGFSGPRLMELDGFGLPHLVFRDGFEGSIPP